MNLITSEGGAQRVDCKCTVSNQSFVWFLHGQRPFGFLRFHVGKTAVKTLSKNFGLLRQTTYKNNRSIVLTLFIMDCLSQYYS